MKLGVFVGTRPEIIKMSSVLAAASNRRSVEVSFVHTGQHYDWRMSEIFLQELGLCEPDKFMNVGSGPFQTGKVFLESVSFLRRHPLDIVLVEGDTNSAVGVALAARQLGLEVGHVEAGCRSFEMSMPEEINRRIIADCATLNFAPTPTTVHNLKHEGVPSAKIHLTGHPVVKVIFDSLQKARNCDICKRLDVDARDYVVLTTHRQENVDRRERLSSILRACAALKRKCVFPIHPRTMNNINRFQLRKLLSSNAFLSIQPCSFIEMLALQMNAFLVMTDSGGIQMEAALLGVPCVTLRRRTEWVETLRAGVNFLCEADESSILKAVKKVERDHEAILKRFANTRELFGDLEASNRILRICTRDRSRSEACV